MLSHNLHTWQCQHTHRLLHTVCSHTKSPTHTQHPQSHTPVYTDIHSHARPCRDLHAHTQTLVHACTQAHVHTMGPSALCKCPPFMGPHLSRGIMRTCLIWGFGWWPMEWPWLWLSTWREYHLGQVWMSPSTDPTQHDCSAHRP
jgi:hypothetical protein